MRAREPGQDNPWLLVGMWLLAVLTGVFGLWCWAQILPGGVAR